MEDKRPYEMGMMFNISIVQDGISVRFEFRIPEDDMRLTPPSIHWENKDGTDAIRTWVTGYFKTNELHQPR